MTGPSFLRANPHSKGQDDDFGYAVRGIVTAGLHLSVTCLTSIETLRWCQHAPCRPRSAPFRAIVDGDAAALHRVVRGLCLTPVVSACAKAKAGRRSVPEDDAEELAGVRPGPSCRPQGRTGLCVDRVGWRRRGVRV